MGYSRKLCSRKKGQMLLRFPTRVVAAYWRLTRGATLGAQGVVIGENESVLLVRHSYRPGWHFPGGGIEWGETAETALGRELFEEAGVIVKGKPQLHGLFANFAWLPSDHVALFIVRDWERPATPAANNEILESRFFPRMDLPTEAAAAVRRRVDEIFEGAPKNAYW
jgi:ADP-ribose pyrophosphatase YjhB (NUDIX family)